MHINDSNRGPFFYALEKLYMMKLVGSGHTKLFLVSAYICTALKLQETNMKFYTHVCVKVGVCYKYNDTNSNLFRTVKGREAYRTLLPFNPFKHKHL